MEEGRDRNYIKGRNREGEEMNDKDGYGEKNKYKTRKT